MKALPAFFLALLFLPGIVLAQQKGEPAARAEQTQAEELAQATRVTFTLQAALRFPANDPASLPLSFLERLEQEPSLVRLDIEGAGQAHLRAQFGFTGLEAFTQWYQGEAAQSLLHAFQEESLERVNYHLSVNRALR